MLFVPRAKNAPDRGHISPMLENILVEQMQMVTCKDFRAMTESEQESVATKIVNKIVDFAKQVFGSPEKFGVEDITKSKGDVEKIKNWNVTSQTIIEIYKLNAGLKDKCDHVIMIFNLYDFITNPRTKKIFKDAYENDNTALQFYYVSIVLVLMGSLSLVLADLINFSGAGIIISDPKKNPAFVNSTAIKQLEYLHKEIKSGSIRSTISRLSQVDFGDVKSKTAVTESLVLGTMITVAAVFASVFIIRHCIQFIFRMRSGISNWLELQSRFLKVNANRISLMNAVAAKKQLEIAEDFKKLANVVSVEIKDAEAQVNSDLEREASTSRSDMTASIGLI